MDFTLSIITAEKILALFIMLCFGVLGNRMGLLDKQREKMLSNLLINLITPVTFFVSFQQEFDSDKFMGLLITFGIAALAHLIPIAIGHFAFKDDPKHQWQIDRYCCTYGNCAFIGIPLIQNILGYEGVFYVTAFITIFNILVFTHGVRLISDGEAHTDLLHSVILNPIFIGIGLGLVCYLCRFMLPPIVLDPLRTLGNCNTPIAMLVAGSSLTGTNFKQILKSGRTYSVSVIRLFIVPLLMIAICALLHIEQNVALSTIICAGAPVGTMATVLAVQYDKDAAYSSGLFAFTTIICLITLPFVVAIYSLVM